MKSYRIGKKMYISESKTADTRSSDVSKVSKEQLLASSKQHINDVQVGISMLSLMLSNAAKKHDHTKISGIDAFYKDFKNDFKTKDWWEKHVVEERHHLSSHVPDDVNLIDVLEYLVDGCMAGMGRTGKYRKEDLPKGMLQKAFDNTIDLMINNIIVKKEK